jgi:hypothetical protein
MTVPSLVPSLLHSSSPFVPSREGVIRAYLDEVAIPVVHAQGARLLAGPLLHAMENPPGSERVVDQIAVLNPAGPVRPHHRHEPVGAAG